MLLVLILLILIPCVSLAGDDCTDGIDCPEDCWGDSAGTGANVPCTGTNTGLTCAGTGCRDTRGGNGIPIRTSAVGGVGAVVMAEDFENPDYTNHTASSNGWYDASCGLFEPHYRGCDSAWTLRWGTMDFACQTPTNTPIASQCVGAGNPHGCCTGSGTGCPSQGGACCPPGSSCDGSRCEGSEYTAGTDYIKTGSDSPTSAAAYSCVDIWNSDTEPHNQESGALGIPDCPGDDGLSSTTGDNIEDCGPFDGKQAFAERWIPGCRTAGFVGNRGFSELTTLGVTYAMAFPDNHGTSTIDDAEWKFDEWDDGSGDSLCGGIPCSEFWMHGASSAHGGSGNNFPMGGIMFGSNTSGLVSSMSGPGPGTVEESAAGLAIRLVPGDYNRSTDWPYGTWACIQGKISGMGTSSTRIQKWFNGTLIFDRTINGTLLANQGYERFYWDAYSNVANNCSGSVGINQLSRRNRDNLVITDGNPVSCAEIGSAGGVVGGEPEVEPPTLEGVVISDLVNDPTWWVYNLMETR